MPTGLTHKFYLGGIPAGLTFELTSIRPTAPNDGYGWKGSFRRSNFIVSITGQHIYDHWPMPFQVSTTDGFIGEAHFEGHNGLWSNGEGAKVAIDFRLSGTTTVAGKTVEVNDTGTLVASTTEWGGPKRPDYVNTTYSWKNSTEDPVNVALSVPPTMAGMPDDLYFVYAVSPERKEAGVVTTTHKDIVFEVVDLALKGIFMVHEKLFGWAKGKLW